MFHLFLIHMIYSGYFSTNVQVLFWQTFMQLLGNWCDLLVRISSTFDSADV